MKKINCAYCGKEMVVSPSRLKKCDHVCCSVDCSRKYKKENNPNYISCAVCGEKTYKKPHIIKKAKHPLTCSVECLAILRKTIYKGENNPNYGNTGLNNPMSKQVRIGSGGYRHVRVDDHPFAVNNGWVRQHRLVAEKYLLTDENSVEVEGERYLDPKLEVHHKNQKRTDNRPSNLEIMTKSEHMKLHHSMRE